MRSFATSASESGAPDIQKLNAKARQEKFMGLFRQFCERVDERAASFGPWASPPLLRTTAKAQMREGAGAAMRGRAAHTWRLSRL